VAYSDGGQLLATSNASFVDIFDPLRLQLLCTLFGHKGIIRQLKWTQKSKFLVSSCSNGSIFVWRGNFKDTRVVNDI
jgi:WD40 repeat protein